ncbi:ABC transporter permease [Nonomuraea spiralis]|uniref:Transport permease protein n=1 Tax=Nonomuraea spiralis TaxID=46182 RepID=A0ABV5IBE7_9ACTN|nr:MULTISPECIES: ABC transporter permease [Nonomuraea]RSN03538.1 ABC transporter permease [Nonomuraea sp. WAC 01424]GGS80593.1 transport permease protein [Nonomuraea spiralis]
MTKILLVEAKLHLREWPFMIFTIGLPVGLLLVLGLSVPDMTKADASGLRVVDTHMPAMMALLALLTLACSVLPTVLAGYREQGVLRRMSTTPVHPVRLLTAQLVINVTVGAVSTLVLIVTAKLVFGSAAPRQWAGFVLVFLLGTAAMMAIGLVIAALAPNGKAASGIGSMVMFPLMFVGGMWLPREAMPDALRVVSDYSVAGPFAQALKDTWAGHSPQLLHVVVMAAGLVLFGGLAVRLFRWE